eukprot:166814_1
MNSTWNRRPDLLHDLVNGYISRIYSMLQQNTIIPLEIKHLCFLYCNVNFINICVKINEYHKHKLNSKLKCVVNGEKNIQIIDNITNPQFTFDKIYASYISENNIFNDLIPFINNVFTGHNLSIISYGSSNSGKTNHHKNITRQTMEYIFKQKKYDIRNKEICCSIFEIFKGKMFDLVYSLQDTNTLQVTSKAGWVNTIDELTQLQITSFDEFMFINNIGIELTKYTYSNGYSPGNHKIVICDIENAGKIFFVQLAGSERYTGKKSGASVQTIHAANVICRGLNDLRETLKSIQANDHDIKYGYSTLTNVLKNNLGETQDSIAVIYLNVCSSQYK